MLWEPETAKSVITQQETHWNQINKEADWLANSILWNAEVGNWDGSFEYKGQSVQRGEHDNSSYIIKIIKTKYLLIFQMQLKHKSSETYFIKIFQKTTISKAITYTWCGDEHRSPLKRKRVPSPRHWGQSWPCWTDLVPRLCTSRSACILLFHLVVLDQPQLFISITKKPNNIHYKYAQINSKPVGLLWARTGPTYCFMSKKSWALMGWTQHI